MAEVDAGLFTVGVFQDVTWAGRGIEALKERGFDAGDLTVIAKQSPEVDAFVKRALGRAGAAVDVKGLGPVVATGSMIDALQGRDAALVAKGVAATMRRVGFQPHDGLIFERLTERGGVLVAVDSEPRAADALAVLHAFGGGNAAIGAWRGRV